MAKETLNKTTLTANALFFEYSSAVNPIMSPIPCVIYKSELHKSGITRVIPFDLSETLHCESPSTGPSVSACYLRIIAGENLTTSVNASSQLFYVIRGAGNSKCEHGTIDWSEGDVFTLPASGPVIHTAQADTAIYYINDAPLLRYLGVKSVAPRFEPVLYTRDRIVSELKKVDQQIGARQRNRNAIILGNKQINQIKSLTHTLWAAVVFVGAGEIQRPHRHNSIAVDIVISAEPGCYTLLGTTIDERGNIVNPQRIDWEAGAAFVTPPTLWHGHYNESKKPAMVMAAQEAGFYEYLRTLDIRFT